MVYGDDWLMVVNKPAGLLSVPVKTENVVLHSAQGWQYQHAQYQLALKQHGITQSMSRKGNCLDNSMMENFFGLLKNEFYYANHFADEQTFLKGLAECINYYNNDRIKLRLSMESCPIPTRIHKQHVNEHANS